ncbi:probable low-specificity L-threonine aldolase 2 [Haliotis rufescens]|uniref:probable low-specificity L-threonine aldolase 2 n=1 Tax=Haliotis rufescens TaxID=6454 RepID=UPI00201F10C4|nr:probable low-specificity L-threonine aldolase 2 [Haliotis rufescens]XP_046359364.2 probable low-specificity L-threonine aldolase 2 [Haliotis rufescens]
MTSRLVRPALQPLKMQYQVRSYNGSTSARPTKDGCHVVDLRSDTVTKPTTAMRQAMATAEVGDDVMGEDPTVNELQRRCSALFGTEDSLLVPSGTMGNLISVVNHCQGRFQEAIVGDRSHMFLYEVGSMAQFAGVQCYTAPNQADGTILLEDIRNRIRVKDDDHLPWTKLICLENTQNKCGGKVLPLSYLAEVKSLANEKGVKLHLDGARVFNAATALDVPVSDIVQHVDSVSVCFSKGLACPVGSILAGTKDFISMARRTRKALGGGMRQAGILAAAMLSSLDTIVPRLHEDHSRAKKIAEGIMASPSNKVVEVDVPGVQTNIFMIEMTKSGGLTPDKLCQRMSQVTDAERGHLGSSVSALMYPFSETGVRLVTHNDITDEDVDRTISKFQYVLAELSQ